MNITTHRLVPKKPFSFRHSLAFVGGFSPMAGEQAVDEGRLRLRKAHEIGGKAVVIDVAPSEDDALTVTLHAHERLAEREEAEALDRIRFILSLDDDLAPFYALAEKDAPFAPVARDQRGHHHVKFPSAFEITVWAVLAQRTPMPMARSIKRALVERFGTGLEVDGERHPAFPSAARLANVTEADLRSVVKHAIKASAIAEIARAYEGMDETWLRNGPFAEVSGWLSDLPRIGVWSTAFVLYRGLGRMERLEVKEGPILDCAKQVYGPRVDVGRVADSYGEHVGIWCLYMRTVGAAIRPAASCQAA